MLRMYQAKSKNILEVYCPTHSTVNAIQAGKEVSRPLFAGFVFVLSIHTRNSGRLHEQPLPGRNIAVQTEGCRRQ